MRTGLALAIVLAGSPAWAQRVELTPLVAYSSTGRIEQTATGVTDLAIENGVTWGGQATYFLFTNLGIEALWTYQSTELGMSTPSGSATLFTMTVNQLYGSIVYQVGGGDATVRPFVFGGVGATSFFNGSEMTGETKFAWTAGLGLKWLLERRIALKAQARFTPTQLNGGASEFCGPFGFCQGLLSRFEIAVGPTFRF
jgi:hypothetical protein